VPRDGGQAVPGCEPESGAEEGDEPDRRAPPVSASGRRKEGGAGGFRPGRTAGPRRERGEAGGRAGPRGGGRKKGLGQLGRTGRVEKRRKRRWAGPRE
jgi:hypothetical protein